MKDVILFLLLIIITSCGEFNKVNEINEFENFPFVYNYEVINDKCKDSLENVILELYSNSDQDTIMDIYYLNAELFLNNYSFEEENNKYEKYAVKIRTTDSIRMYFFVIDKENSMLRWATFLPEYKILTVNYHLIYFHDFHFLTKNGYGSIKELDAEWDPKGEIFMHRTLELNSNNIWKIDSISHGVLGESFFKGIKEFNVIDNSEIISTEATLFYEFVKYDLLIRRNEILLKHWLISWSSSHRIIKDDFGNYIFISIIRPNSNLPNETF